MQRRLPSRGALAGSPRAIPAAALRRGAGKPYVIPLRTSAFRATIKTEEIPCGSFAPASRISESLASTPQALQTLPPPLAIMARWTGKVRFASGAVCRDHVLELLMIATRLKLQKLIIKFAHHGVMLATLSVAISVLTRNCSPMSELSVALDSSCTLEQQLSRGLVAFT